MKMQQEAWEVLGASQGDGRGRVEEELDGRGRVEGANFLRWEVVVHLGGTEGRLGLRGLTRCH